ncbi:DUF1361 domain-containing protein [Carboxylicivirga sediminis]|uniref:DUF1361 domain-containing protein n=1 Tax=Carboxylicivirga sediminis TaxID=2006564 RepID=A0A941F2H9_9BACT|nr:DUF1361 domain-containing protein [Carboxylicivirga sediminis]MBR8535563.1 DUF1361 domain-containing protein [Carboxylicivirga sediminis]
MKKRPSLVSMVLLLTLANLLILVIRNVIVGNDFYSFLRSNLFIGSFPVIAISSCLYYFNHKINTPLFWIGSFLWFIFYPNAPYMISDLIHDSQDPISKLHPEMIKYDTLIIFSLAMLSVFYGFLSLKMMFQLFKKRYSNTLAHIAIHFTIVMSCLGFYMGRELLSAIKLGNGYLYSWEIFLEPIQIIKIVWKALWPIHEHWPAYAMMLLFGAVQYLLLIIFHYINSIEIAPEK